MDTREKPLGMGTEVMPLGGVPFKAMWDEYISDAHWKHLVRVKKIVPCKARTNLLPLVVTGDPSKDKRCNPIILKRLRIASRLFLGKRNRQLLFDLAVWHSNRKNKEIPKRGLTKHMDDLLWGILQHDGVVPLDCYGLENLNKTDRNKLEKRLHQHWPIVKQAAKDFYVNTTRASNARLKLKKPSVQALLQGIGSAKT